MKIKSKIKMQSISATEQKTIRDGYLIREATCPDGHIVKCASNSDNWEVLKSHNNTVVLGIRCENVYEYCDGHTHIEGSGTGSGTDSGTDSGTGSGTGSGTDSGTDSGTGSGTFF